MKKLFLIIFIIFLSPLNVFSKTILNKGIICESQPNGLGLLLPINGFWFGKNNNVTVFFEWISDFKGHKGKYKEKDFHISMSFPKHSYLEHFLFDGEFKINRESGNIKKRSKSENTQLFNSENFICDKVFLTENDLMIGLKERSSQRYKKDQMKQLKKQKELEEKMKNRLIKRKF